MPRDVPKSVVDAALGLADAPQDKFTDAFRIYCEEINRTELSKKLPGRLRKWRVIPERHPKFQRDRWRTAMAI